MIRVAPMRQSAGAAQNVVAFLQAMAHGHPLVEHIAFALPAAVAFRHFLQIAQDAAAQMIDILKAA